MVFPLTLRGMLDYLKLVCVKLGYAKIRGKKGIFILR